MANTERLISSLSLFQTYWNKGFPCKLSLGRQHAADISSARAPNPRPHTTATDVPWDDGALQLILILRKPQETYTQPVIY